MQSIAIRNHIQNHTCDELLRLSLVRVLSLQSLFPISWLDSEPFPMHRPNSAAGIWSNRSWWQRSPLCWFDFCTEIDKIHFNLVGSMLNMLSLAHFAGQLETDRLWNPFSWIHMKSQIDFGVHFIHILSTWSRAPAVSDLERVHRNIPIELLGCLNKWEYDQLKSENSTPIGCKERDGLPAVDLVWIVLFYFSGRAPPELNHFWMRSYGRIQSNAIYWCTSVHFAATSSFF